MTREATLEELSDAECFHLLRTQPVGRLAVAGTDTCPIVVPVNYVVDGRGVVFRTDDGTKLRALEVARASFEVDSVDPHSGTGWSVLVRGRIYFATAWEISTLNLDPWAPGSKKVWIRLSADVVTGRRLDVADAGSGARGYV